MSYPIDDLKTIGPGVAATFKSCGIRSTANLLAAAKDPKGRKTLADKTGIPEKDILRSANMADRLRIKGVGEDYAVLLEAAGVDPSARAETLGLDAWASIARAEAGSEAA